MGSVLHGRSPDEVKRSESGTFSTDDEKALLELVTDAVEKGEPNTPGPQFSIHQKSGALIVKATAAQQETVEQAIKALKENKEESKELEAQQEIVKQAIKALKETRNPRPGRCRSPSPSRKHKAACPIRSPILTPLPHPGFSWIRPSQSPP